MSSIPPSDPAPLRHLGTGNPGPVRSPMIYGLIALLLLVALPLYLIRKPKPVGPLPADAGVRADNADAGAVKDDPGKSPTGEAVEPPTALPDAGAAKKIVLGEPRAVRCTTKSGVRMMAERCDHLVALEDALTRSIRENLACAPPSVTPYTVSFVLTVDFDKKKLHLWAGRSGTLKKRSSTDLVHCIEHAIAPPDFATLAHQYAKYDINVMASYPATATSGLSVGGS